MRWLLIPSDDYAGARKLVRRVDEILGYPREHPSEDVTYHGRARALVGGRPVRTETHMAIMLHDTTGDARLHGVVAVGFTPAIIDALRERLFDVSGVKRRLREIITERDWEVRSTLPDPNNETRQPWTRREPRDGQPGSATGEPIPPGEE